MADVMRNPAPAQVPFQTSTSKIKEGLHFTAKDVPVADRPAYHAYQTLHVVFVALPIIAGLDKFFYFSTDWSQYLAPVVSQMTDLTAPNFLAIVGVIEIIAGLGVLMKPKIFGYVVAAWLAGIILNLLILGDFYDIVLRDLALAFAALSLSQLAQTFETRRKQAFAH